MALKARTHKLCKHCYTTGIVYKKNNGAVPNYLPFPVRDFHCREPHLLQESESLQLCCKKRMEGSRAQGSSTFAPLAENMWAS